MNPRAEVLDLANRAVNGDRNAQYGEPYHDFARTAAMLNGYFGLKDFFQPHDVAAIQVMVKLSRIRQSPGKQDSWVDIAGYAACGYETADHFVNSGVTEANTDA